MRNKDLEGTNEVCERNALVLLPLLKRLGVVDEDDEVVLLALVVDLGLLCFSLRHDCVCLLFGEGCGCMLVVGYVGLIFDEKFQRFCESTVRE